MMDVRMVVLWWMVVVFFELGLIMKLGLLIKLIIGKWNVLYILIKWWIF